MKANRKLFEGHGSCYPVNFLIPTLAARLNLLSRIGNR
jgi:hypothetical protein